MAAAIASSARWATAAWRRSTSRRTTSCDRPVAIKLLAEHLASDTAFRERFLREARLAARLSHPNVVTVYDAGEAEDGRPYIVMEYVPGTTLAELGRVPPVEAVGLAVQACRGLEHAHSAGLVHRDVKPQNLLLREDGTVKVADFGIARAAETTALTQVGTVLGTAAYLSPEQALGEQVTAAADVYSLGAVLYELLTGRPPYEFDSLADLAPSRPPGRSRRSASSRRSAARRRGRRHALARAQPGLPPGLGGRVRGGARGRATTRPVPLHAPTRVAPAHADGPGGSGRPSRQLLIVAAIVLGVVLATRGGSSPPPPPRQTVVRPIPHGADAQQQAEKIAAWLRARAARP